MPFEPVHYLPRRISEILKTDLRVALVGTITQVKENSFVLEDETGKVEIISGEPVEKEKLVRVFCSVVDEKLKADVIQDLTGLDLNLYKAVEELYNRAGVNV